MNNLNDINDFELLNNVKGEDIISLYRKYLAFKSALKTIPIKTLQSNGWLNDYKDTQSIGTLFSNTLIPHNPLFRKNSTTNDALIALWLAKVTATAKERVAQNNCNFEKLTKEQMKEIAQLSKHAEIIKELPDILAKKGILLIYEKPIPGLKMDGLAFLLPSGIPVIALSFRYARLDSFWFTLMHELAHIVLHYELLKTPIIDDFENEKQKDDIEVQANRLAKDSLVTNSQWRNCPAKYNTNPQEVIKFADNIGIHSAIVAGLLRKERNKYNMYSELVNCINTRELIFNHD
ncbi:MAG: ImmA/IrrE family metallo-endopeptidase [Methylococcales bacterium]|nr:ImmA/IrrE family metallo-endopeptidase [Methylococcales bacterium]